MEKSGKYKIHFMKGAFFIEVREIGGDMVVSPIQSKYMKEVDALISEFDELEPFFETDTGKEVLQSIQDEEIIFDFIVLVDTEQQTAKYYINTKDGVKKCEI